MKLNRLFIFKAAAIYLLASNYSIASAQSCTELAKAADVITREYRSDLRALARSCDGGSILGCGDARVAIVETFSRLSDKQNELLSDCTSDAPPPPGVGRAPVAGEVIATEFMVDPDGLPDTAGEWIELANLTNETLNLIGHELVVDLNSHVILSDLILQPLELVVLGINGDFNSNGGVNVDYVYSSLILKNEFGDFWLADPEGIIIDSASYANLATGRSYSLDPLSFDPELNDLASGWCPSFSEYGSFNFGTPGALNDVCPLTGN